MSIHQRLAQLETKFKSSEAMAETRNKLSDFMEAMGAESNAEPEAVIRAFLDDTNDGAYDYPNL